MARRELSGLRCLVTGASSGIGRELARELARQGARLVLTARRVERLTELAAELAATCGDVTIVAGDVTDPATRASLVARVSSHWSSLDVLINNAGSGAYGNFADSDEATLRQMFEVNFFAATELTRLALPLLRQGRTPAIVNIGSVLGHRAVPRKSEYCAAKFALHGWSDSLRAELATDGIDVVLVSPSTTQSEFFASVPRREDGSRPPEPTQRGMTAAQVASRTIRALRQGRHEVILSLGGSFLVWFDRLFPSWADRAVARWSP